MLLVVNVRGKGLSETCPEVCRPGSYREATDAGEDPTKNVMCARGRTSPKVSPKFHAYNLWYIRTVIDTKITVWKPL